MRTILLGLAAALSLAACQTAGGGSMTAGSPAKPAASTTSAPVSSIDAAVADPSRPAADSARDVDRKPVAMLQFAGVKPGQKVADLIPGGGYFTRIFAKTVGASGHVYAIVNPPQPGASPPPPPPPVVAIAASAGYGNVSVLIEDLTKLSAPEPLDVVWTAQNYHDLHLRRFNLDVAAVNKAIYAALKPGGLYVVLDHAAAAGSGLRDPDLLHRIDPAQVKKEVEAAGFVFVEESGVLRNPADDHSKLVFDPAIRGHTDQFIYKFRKPG